MLIITFGLESWLWTVWLIYFERLKAYENRKVYKFLTLICKLF